MLKQAKGILFTPEDVWKVRKAVNDTGAKLTVMTEKLLNNIRSQIRHLFSYCLSLEAVYMSCTENSIRTLGIYLCLDGCCQSSVCHWKWKRETTVWKWFVIEVLSTSQLNP